MTERFVANKGSEGLTSKTLAPKLEMQGVIFMPDGSTAPETQQPQITPDSTVQAPRPKPPETTTASIKQNPSERQQKIEEQWIEALGNKPTKEDLDAIKMAAKKDIPPYLSGAEESIPPVLINVAMFTDTTLKNIAMEINYQIARQAGKPLDPRLLFTLERRLESLHDEKKVNQQEAHILLNIVKGWSGDIERGDERFGFYLQSQDLAMLRKDPLRWLDDQFDVLYKIAEEGQELNSQVVNNVQTVTSEAMRFLQYSNPDQLEEFQTVFTNRFNLMHARTAINYRSMQEIKGAALKLRTHGLFYGFTMENGKVGTMFSRLHEVLEDERLKSNPEHHVTPEAAYKLQQKVIKEQIDLAMKGVGHFAPKEDEVVSIDKLEREITRTIRTAYDILVASQRQAVIVARGKRLSGDYAYFSDPSSGPLNVYNIEDLLTEKFDIFNLHDYEFLERIKLDIADGHIKEQRRELEKLQEKLKREAEEEKRNALQAKIIEQQKKVKKFSNLEKEERIDLGRRLFRDFFAVPDFFSSGWRIQGILDSIEERFVARFGQEGKEKAKNFALFMRLKKASGLAERRGVWKKIANYRPEEILRLFRERLEKDEKLTNVFKNDVFKNYRSATSPEGISNYDQFKEEFGAILRFLRDNALEEYRQISIQEDGFTNKEKLALQRFLGAEKSEEIKEIFKVISDFANNSIDDLMNNPKFEDIYTRTILIDDALLTQLEKTENQHKEDKSKETVQKFSPISKKYAADIGGDSYVRNWNDTENATKAATALVAFIKSEDAEGKIKTAEEFAEATSQYNGQGARAKCIRYTIGSFLKLSKSYFLWDALGVGKLPFRQAISDIEKIYGPQAVPQGRDTLRQTLDKLHLLLLDSLGKQAREGEMSKEEYKEAKKDAEKMYKDLETVLEVSIKDTLKRRTFSLFFFLVLAAFAEAGFIIKDLVKPKG